MANREQKPTGQEPEPQEGEQVFMALTRDDLIALVRELRRDPELEKKMEAEAERVRRRRDAMIRLAAQDEAAKKQREASCRHLNPHGHESSAMMPHSDGKTRVYCLRCQKVLRWYWAPEIAQGMAIKAKMQALGLTEEDLDKAMAAQGGDGFEPGPVPEHDPFARGVGRHPIEPTQTTANSGR